ncbi:MAG: hypothetical protein JXK07_10985 [Spirochaetes bacterium]|nr:hypothetical protein [Spirochaetota bacterium]MBN2772375.1 hypothetical protein [Spirochaetota bacterium]
MEITDFRTSIDVEVSRLEKIENYAQKYNMDISDVMNTVLDMYSKKLAENPVCNDSLNRYQERGTHYKSVHIRFSSITKRKLKDIANLYCYSLSYMLFLAMDFFEEFMNGVSEFVRPVFHAAFVHHFFGFPYFINSWGMNFYEGQDQDQPTGQESQKRRPLLC